MISFVIPAHNEETLLPPTLESIRAATVRLGEPVEVIVVDDGSTDHTSDVAQTAGARVVRIEARHIAAARNAGARTATGELLVFVDADTQVNPDVLLGVRRAVTAGAVGGGCAVRFERPVPLWVRALEPVFRVGSRWAGMAAGCFLYCTRDAFVKVGGFDERMFAAEEAEMSRRLRGLGRFVMLREEVITSGRKFRAYTGWELAGAMAGLVIRGRRGLRDRRRLGMWYGPRAPDRPERDETSR